MSRSASDLTCDPDAMFNNMVNGGDDEKSASAFTNPFDGLEVSVLK